MAAETVTVLFTDLVGSTALMAEVGAEAAEELRREHFGLLRGAIQPSSGREVKNLGDGLMVVFASAADGVAAAVGIQQAFEERNRHGDHPLLVRVGLSLGDADVEAGDYFGVPVVESARLCALAEGGEIFSTDLVRLLAGTRGGYAFEALGEVELKGMDHPVAACRVGWTPNRPSEERPPLPARLASSVSNSFVGRDLEHQKLTAVWKAVTAGEHRLVLVAGEPGIGKTTLAARFATEVYGNDGLVVYGRCDEDLGIPYQPWIEALNQLVGQLPDAVLADHIGVSGASLSRLIPDLARRLPAEVSPAGDADTERFVLFGCVVDLMARASAEHPLLIVLDDLHWADRPSVQLLRHVVTSDHAMRVAVLGTFRDSDVAAGHPLADVLAAFHREKGTERIALRGLTDEDLLALLERVAGHEMTVEGVALRDALLTETAGNPFFVGEILRHLAETGAIYQGNDGEWIANHDLRASGLPVSVKEVVGRRLSGLGPDTERVLGFGAVIGRDFDVALLAAVAHVDEDELVSLCDAAVAAAVLKTTGDADNYTFAHALIEHTLYDGLSPARRARAHRAVAEELERRYGLNPGERAGELAHHWGAAVQPSDVAKAIHYAVVAAERALDQLAPDEALRWYGEALDLHDRGGDDDRQRAEILIGLGDAQRQCGVGAHRETLLAAAHIADRIGATDLLVRAAVANSRGFQSIIGATDHERVDVIIRALKRLGAPGGESDSDEAARGRLLALECVERIYDPTCDLEARLGLAERAVEAARRSADRGALVQVLQLTAQGTGTAATLELRITRSTEACEVADALGEPAAAFWAHNARMLDALEAGDGTGWRTHFAAIEEAALRVPQASVLWNLAFHRATHSIVRGDVAEADRLAEAAFMLGSETGQPDPLGIYGAQLVNIRQHQGRLDELIPLVEQVIVDSPGMPVYRAVLALACAFAGETGRTQSLLDGDRPDGFPMPADSGWSSAYACWTEAAVRLGDLDAAAILHERLAPFPDRIVTSSITINCAVSHYLAMLDHLLGRYNDADRWFGEAIALHERLGSALLIAYTQAAWAALLADRHADDDHVRARVMAEKALATATAGGYGYIKADALEVLGRLTS